MKSTEAQKKAQRRYYQKNKDYYHKKSLEDAKKTRLERKKYKNAIIELENYMRNEWQNDKYGAEYKIALSKIYYKLQELKDDSK